MNNSPALAVRRARTRRGIVRFRRPRPFPAFTLMETVVALALVVAAMVLVVQLACWSMQHRLQTAAHALAIEQAANVLERAGATPWESLNDDWAAAMRLNPAVADQLPDATLSVRITPLQPPSRIRQVAVEVRWMIADQVPSPPVRLTGWFSPRVSEAARP